MILWRLERTQYEGASKEACFATRPTWKYYLKVTAAQLKDETDRRTDGQARRKEDWMAQTLGSSEPVLMPRRDGSLSPGSPGICFSSA